VYRCFCKSFIIDCFCKAVDDELEPFGLEELMKEQTLDEYWQKVIKECQVNGADHFVDECGLIVRTDPNIERLQVCVPESLRERATTLAHYQKLESHPCSTRMYQTMRRDIFWPSMSWDVQEFVRLCNSCAKKRLSVQRKTTFLKLFPSSAPFEFVAMDILGPLPETKKATGFCWLSRICFQN
jgi:Integrase zinc binding domain